MEHFFTLLLHLISTAFLSPLGLIAVFGVAFSGELGVSPPAALEAAFTAAGVGLAHGSAAGLVLYPVVLAAAVLGTTTALWMSQRGLRLLSRFAKPPAWTQSAGFMQRLPSSSPLTIALIRQLPGAQLPLTALWAATGGPRRPFLVGVALSAAIHWTAVLLMAASIGRLLPSSGNAFAFAFPLSVAVSMLLLVVAQLPRVWSAAARSRVPKPDIPLEQPPS